MEEEEQTKRLRATDEPAEYVVRCADVSRRPKDSHNGSHPEYIIVALGKQSKTSVMDRKLELRLLDFAGQPLSAPLVVPLKGGHDRLYSGCEFGDSDHIDTTLLDPAQVEFSPTGDQLACLSEHGYIRIFNVSVLQGSGMLQPVCQLSHVVRYRDGFHFTWRDPTSLFACDRRGVFVMNVHTRKGTWTRLPYAQVGFRGGLTRNGRFIAVGDSIFAMACIDDRTIEFEDFIASLSVDFSRTVTSLKLAPNKQHLGILRGNLLEIVNVDTKECTHRFTGVSDMDWTPGSKLVTVVRQTSGEATVWVSDLVFAIATQELPAPKEVEREEPEWKVRAISDTLSMVFAADDVRFVSH